MVVYVVLWLYNSVDWNLDMHVCMFLCVSVVVTQQRAVVGVYCNWQSSTRTNLTELYPWCIWSLFLWCMSRGCRTNCLREFSNQQLFSSEERKKWMDSAGLLLINLTCKSVATLREKICWSCYYWYTNDRAIDKQLWFTVRDHSWPAFIYRYGN